MTAASRAKPTPKPTLNPTFLPSSVPTSEPTESITTQWLDKYNEIQYQYGSVHYDEVKIAKSLITYFDVKVNDEDVSSASSTASGCYRWDRFLSVLSTQQIGFSTAYISVMAFDSLGTDLKNVPNITCNVASVAQSISDALVSDYQSKTVELSASCLSTENNGQVSYVKSTWKVGRCGTSPYLSVYTNSSTGASSMFMRLSPCNDTCDQSITTDTTTSSTFMGSVGVIRSVAIQFTAQYPAPTIMSLSVQAVSKSTVQTVVQLDEPGLVYCAAYDTATYVVPSSVEAVILSSVSAWSVVVNGKNISSVNITNLAASTEYTVLCAVSSVQSITSSLQTVLTKYNRTVTTLCCRQVLVSVLANSLALTSSSTAIVRNAIKVSVSSLPTGSKQALSVSVYLRKSGVSYLASLSPNALTYTSASTLSSSMLTLLSLSTAGTYNVTVSLSGTAKSLYETVFSGSGSSTISVIDTSTATNIVVAPPTMTSATFSSDGVSISVVFDRSTSLGQELGTNSQFSCSKMFRFSEVTAASLASCQFGANGSAVTIKPASSSTITVGSNITLLGATLKAACFVNYNCSRWKYASTSVLSVVGPAVATVPTVLVAAPSIIGSCTNYVIDVSGSVGSGYRGWKSITYQVVGSALNASDLQAYLTSLSGSSSTASLLRVSVPYAYFNALSVYSITATLCNFLGVCGQSQVSLSVSALSAPVVSVVGPNVISQYSSQVTTLKALAYTTSCGSTASTSANLAYVWSLVARSTTSGQISSANTPKSTTGSLLTIGAYALTPLNTYSVSISVTSLVTKQTSTSSVTIAVLQGLLHAVISGGSTRSVRVLNGAAVDGSGSYDSDQAGYGSVGVSYLWSGYQLTPTYQTSCNILLSYGSSSTATVFGLVNATNSTCVVSLIVGLDTRVASSSISVNFLGELCPKVSISSTSPSSLTHISIASKVSVVASIEQGTSPVLCVWSFDDSVTTVSSSLSLSSIALTSTKTVVEASSSSSSSASVPLNLVIGASQLPSGAQLTLALTCSVVNATSKSLTSVNTILITTNAPPSPGSFTVSPTSGVSLVTVFTYGASAWSDADGDYPLNYQYGFVSPTDGTFVVVSGRSLTVRATSTLPPGVAGSNYGVSTRLNVFDSLSAITSTTLAVRVNNSLFTSSSSGSSSASQKLNISFIGSVVSSGLSSAGLDTDSLKQVISTTAVAMNSVSCDGAPANCTALGRYHCSSVANTCGSCLPNFVGASGASNQACVNVKDLAISGSSGACESSADCANAWYTCDVSTRTCYSPAKTCVNNCTDSSQGICVYEDSVSGVSRDTCTLADISCVAVCECLTGYSGTSCDVSASELASRQSIRTQLLDSMLTVVEAESSSESATVSAWSSGLQTLTSAPSELNTDTVSTAIDLANYVLEANVAEGFAFSVVSAGLLAAVDSLAQSATIQSDALATGSSRRALTSSSSAETNLKQVLDSVATATLTNMVAGEDPSEYETATYRMKVKVFSANAASSSTGTLSSPLSTSESENNVTTAATMTFPLAQSTLSTSSGYSVSMISLKSSIFSSYDPDSLSSVNGSASKYVSLGSYLANPLRMSVQADSSICANSSGTDASSLVTFKFKNAVSMNTSNLWAYPNLTYTTHCTVDLTSSGQYSSKVYNYSCPYGSNITHLCDGSQSMTITSACANRQSVPQCVATVISSSPSTQNSTVSCAVTEFTDDYTLCACNLCDLNASVTSSGRRMRTRRFLSDSASTATYTAEMQSVVTFVAADFAAATLQSTSFSASSLQKAEVVIITFALLWSVIFVSFGAVEISGVAKKFAAYTEKLTLHTGYEGRHGTAFFPHHVDGSAGGAGSMVPHDQAKKLLKAYVFTFFPSIFSEKPAMMKFWHEIVHKHKYFSVAVREDSYRKLVGTLEILSLLTAHMFLVAVLYDLEWPSDSGFCAQQTSLGETTCLKRRSIFDKSTPMCHWESSASSSSGGECMWVEPSFNLSIQIFVMMLVIAFSGPINVIVSALVKVLLLSPTKTEPNERAETIRIRRASALGAFPASFETQLTNVGLTTPRGSLNSARISPDRAENLRDQKDLAPETGGAALKRSPSLYDMVLRRQASNRTSPQSPVTAVSPARGRASSILLNQVATVPALDESLTSYCKDNHSMRRQLSTIFTAPVAVSVHADVSSATTVADVEQPCTDVTTAAAETGLLSAARRFLMGLRQHNNSLVGRERLRFGDQWGDFLSLDVDDDKSAGIRQLMDELQRVNTDAETIIRQLRSLSEGRSREQNSAMIGVQILEMFVLDLMGRQSAQAKLFANQRAAVKLKLATSVWIKGLSLSLLLGLDAYFVFMCINYGNLKGRRWQMNWMISCLVYVLVDIFIKHVNIVFVVYYYIPELIKKHTDVMKLRLAKAIDTFVRHSFSDRAHTRGHTHDDGFSVTDHLFVSSIVARAFPELLESSIVLSYRSFAISEYQAANLRTDQAPSQEPGSPRRSRDTLRNSAVGRLLFRQSSSGRLSRRNLPSSTTNSFWNWNNVTSLEWSTLTSVISVTFVNLLVALGCQSIFVQKLVVQVVDPLIMAAIAFLGSAFVHSSMLGVPIVVGIIAFILAVLGFYSYHKRTKLQSHPSTSKHGQHHHHHRGARDQGPNTATGRVEPNSSGSSSSSSRSSNGSSEKEPVQSADGNQTSAVQVHPLLRRDREDSYDDENVGSDREDDDDYYREKERNELADDDVDGVYEDEDAVLRKVKLFLRSNETDDSASSKNSEDGDEHDNSDDEERGQCVPDKQYSTPCSEPVPRMVLGSIRHDNDPSKHKEGSGYAVEQLNSSRGNGSTPSRMKSHAVRVPEIKAAQDDEFDNYSADSDSDAGSKNIVPLVPITNRPANSTTTGRSGVNSIQSAQDPVFSLSDDDSAQES
jgi:hypothetical protein